MTTTTTPARDTRPRDTRPHDTRPWTQRTVEAITERLATRPMGRRRFLTRAALVGSALAVDPLGFVLRPQSAWASVCGDANECNEGWSAFCATINDGANTCPSGSYPAGWWKIDNTTFCSGRARYIVDCNVTPGASWSCRCANGECDRRRVACNNFRYGQCNTQVSGTTPVVCRIVLCTPPWEWGNCNRTSLTSNQTRTHWSAALPSRTNPTAISVRWLELGLTASALGDIVGSERTTDDGGRWARFDNGVMTKEPGTSRTRVLLGPHADAYRGAGGPDGPMGWPSQSIWDNPAQAEFDNGATYRVSGSRAIALSGGVQREYERQGGRDGWMGLPRGSQARDGRWHWIQTVSGWWVIRSDLENDSRVLRSIEDLPSGGSWPDTVRVVRWAGDSRYDTAVEVSRRAHPNGSPAVLLVRGDDYPDATAAGAVSGRLDAPILLTRRFSLPDATRAEIRRLRPDRVIVLGGGTAVATRVLKDVGTLVDRVERWDGRTRYETAVEVSRQVFPTGTTRIVVASGEDFPDSLTVAPRAHRLGAPVLLTRAGDLPDVVEAEIRRLAARKALVVGGTSAVSPGVADRLRALGLEVDRVAGPNRYATSARVARQLGGDADTVVVSTGRDFPDGLAISSWVDDRRVPILLVDRGIDDEVDDVILQRRPRRIVIVGGTSAVSRQRADQLSGYRV